MEEPKVDAEEKQELFTPEALAQGVKALRGECLKLKFKIKWLPGSSTLKKEQKQKMADTVDADEVDFNMSKKLFTSKHPRVKKCNSAKSALTEAVNGKSFPLSEIPLKAKDRRLILALDQDRHYTEQKQIELVDGGSRTVVEDITTSTVEPYDSIESVYRLGCSRSSPIARIVSVKLTDS